MKQKQKKNDSNVKRFSKKGGYGSVNVWGGIFGNVKTSFIRLYGRVTGDVYVRDILSEKVKPFLRNRVGGMLMYDNAPPHHAIVT